MIYNMLFFGMNAGCYEIFKKFLRNQDEQTVDAKLNRNDVKEIK